MKFELETPNFNQSDPITREDRAPAGEVSLEALLTQQRQHTRFRAFAEQG